MKFLSRCLRILVIGGVAVLAAAAGAAEPEWRELKGQHFLIYHKNDPAGAEQVGRSAEEGYSRITADLGFTKRDDFWTWQNRVRLYLYPTREAFMAGTGSPAWAAGKAVVRQKEISICTGQEGFLDSVLPHELTHLVLRDFIGFEGEIPLWLSEGLAQWEEKAKRGAAERWMPALLKQERLIPFSELTRMDNRGLENSGRVAEFYAQSISLVGYLIRRQGADGFRRFCGQLRDGKSVDDALRFAYPETIRTMKLMEEAWRLYLTQPPEVTP